MATTHDSRERRLRDACQELERRLRAGVSCTADEFLADDNELAEDAEAALELIYAEFVAREQLGQQPGSDDFCRRYPRWAEALGEQLRVHALMADCLDKPADTSGGLAAGSRLGHYLIERELGRGGSGVVYLGRDEKLKRPVAIKVLLSGPHSSAEQVEHLHREAELVAGLQHANFVQVYEVGVHQGWTYVVLEYVTGASLEQRLAQGPLPPRRAAELVLTLAEAIQFAHEHGIVHRDLKPANVLLTGQETPRITDLGLAKQLLPEESQTRSGSLTGTPGYMAPEQARGSSEVGPGCDIYALGALLYHALTGRPPFQTDSVFETLEQVIHDEPVPPRRLSPSIPRDLETICLKCLRKPIGQRYESAGDLSKDLRCQLEQRPIQARPISSFERAALWARRRPLVAALSGVLALTLILLLAGTLWHSRSLRVALDETDRLRQRAENQRNEIEQQLRRTQRGQFALQLSQVQQLWQHDPGRGLELLDDVERCPPELRDFTWRMLHRLCDRQRQRFETKGQTVVAFVPGKPWLVRGDETGILHIVVDGTTQQMWLGQGEAVTALACSVKGQDGLIAVGRADGSVDVWNLGTSKRLHQHTEHTGPVRAIAFANKRTVISGGADGQIHVWNLDDDGRRPLKGHSGAIVALAASPDGRTLASCGPDREVWLWDLDADTHRPAGDEIYDRNRALAFTPDGRLLAVGGDNEQIDLIDPKTGKQVDRLRAHFSPVLSLSVSADGNMLAAGCKDCSLLLFDLPMRKILTTLKGHQTRITSVALSDDLAASASADGDVRIWDAATPTRNRRLVGHKEPVMALAFAPDGNRLASSSFDRTVKLWDPAAGKLVAAIETFPVDKRRSTIHRVRGLAFAPDGKSFLTANEMGYVHRWDAGDGKLLATLVQPPKGQRVRYFALALLDEGKNMLCADAEGFIELRSTTTGDLKQRLRAHEVSIAALAVSPEGKYIASAATDGTAKLWHAADLSLQAELTGHASWVHALAFAGDGTYLASASTDETIRFWNVPDGKERAVLTGHSQSVYALGFAPDGKTLFSGTGDRWRTVPGEVKMWDAKTGYLRATFSGEAGPLAIDPTGRFVASGSADGAIKLWFAPTE